MMRLKQYASSAVQRPLPSYFDIYQKTAVGNPLRRFVVEAYVNTEMGVSKPHTPLVDLPAAMLVDIIQVREETWSSCSQKAFDERLAKIEEDVKKEAEKQFAKNEAERVKEYEERLLKATQTMTRHCNTPSAGGPQNLTIPPPQPSSTESVGSALLEDLKKAHAKFVDEVEKQNKQRYNDLVEVMRKRNSEHLEAVQIMDKATQVKEARLLREIEDLKKFKEESVMATQSTAEETGKTIAELRSIIKEREEAKDVLMQEIDVLKKEHGKAHANAELAESQRVHSLVKNGEALKKANEDLKKANEELEEEAGRHFIELAELKRVHANSEERNRRQLDSLHKKIDENARKYREDIERLQATFKENSDAYKKELARLKKANRELLDQLTVDDNDDD